MPCQECFSSWEWCIIQPVFGPGVHPLYKTRKGQVYGPRFWAVFKLPAFFILRRELNNPQKEVIMTASLCFNEFTFSPLTLDNQPWIRAAELARALGYGRENQVSRLYRNNADEFTPDMTQVVEIAVEPRNGADGRARIFSLRGCHLLAMFARTPVAKAFRRWVLDVIEQYGDRVPVAHPVTLNDAPISPEQRAELKLIVDTKVGMVPKAVQRRAYKEIWTRFNRHFHIAEYKQLSCSRMDDARDFLLSMQVNAGKAEALPQAALPSPCAAHPVIDEKPFLEFIAEVQTTHEEVKRLLSPLRRNAARLTRILGEHISTRANIPTYIRSKMIAEGIIDALYVSSDVAMRQGLISTATILDEVENPGYQFLGIVRQLNGNGRA